jgi:prophage regulatory protein
MSDTHLKLLRLPEVKLRVGLSRSTIYAKIAINEFPAPISLGARSVAWLSSEIQNWIDGRIALSRGGVK